jgi:predicted phage terminase large subunit-like protein
MYMPHKLYDPAYESIADVTLNDFHLDVINYAKSWTQRLDIQNKRHDCFIAPRMTGKSTWINHILPIWAGAYKHKRYLLAFSDSDTQAQRWLGNFKSEIASNHLLNEDFPEFCATTKLGGRDYMDNRNVTMRGNGFIFQVAGADSNVLGANINGQRPEIIIFDDIEPTESNYSVHEAGKRLQTVLSAHWYLNIAAIKVFIGTTTMPESIIDQMRKVSEAQVQYLEENTWDAQGFRNYLEPQHRWVVDNGINVHYWPAIRPTDTGEESLWPEKWSLDYLNAQRGTREFAMNMMNRPVSLDGGYWDEDDIVIDEPLTYGNTILSVDPAVTTKRTSDYTGLAVVSRGDDNRLYVRHAEQVKYTSEELKNYVDELLERYDARVLYIETNQGGDLWKQVFGGVKAKYRQVRQSEKKEVRAAQAHDIYRKGQVAHARHFPALEEQMLAFPRVPHDDVLDAVVSAVLYFSQNNRRPRAQEINYLEAS